MAKGQRSTSLADLNFSMGNSVENKEREQINFEHSQIAKSDAPVIVEQSHKVYKLVNTKIKGRVHIGGVDDAINPKTNKPVINPKTCKPLLDSSGNVVVIYHKHINIIKKSKVVFCKHLLNYNKNKEIESLCDTESDEDSVSSEEESIEKKPTKKTNKK